MAPLGQDLLTIRELAPEQISLILDTAVSMKEVSAREIKKVPTLRGKTIINLFFEPSTRTRTSFEVAGKRLSADVINISANTSSVVKGETLEDTGKNLQAMNPDLIVLRHSSPGAPQMLAGILPASIINAGDGAHEHPTQALLDAFTIREKKERLEGLNVVIVGDITHSRVARSNIHLLHAMGARVRVCGPRTMVPLFIESLGVEYEPDMDQALQDMDVIMMLRIQKERQSGSLFPTIREYARWYGLNRERLARARDDVLIMHPGPVNRGVEISPDIFDSPCSIILDQVTNGVAVRMALMYLLIGK
jgi:aspartate carbamoyltransferase catalytic subunit